MNEKRGKNSYSATYCAADVSRAGTGQRKMPQSRSGSGAAICIDGVVPHEFASRVAFRPFSPALTSDVYLAWRKNAALSPAAAALVETVRAISSGRQT